MAAKFYIVKPEYTRPSEDVPFQITGVQFHLTSNPDFRGCPATFASYAAARTHASYLYKHCGWTAPLVVGADAKTANERRAIVADKALRCYGGKMTIKEAGKA